MCLSKAVTLLLILHKYGETPDTSIVIVSVYKLALFRLKHPRFHHSMLVVSNTQQDLCNSFKAMFVRSTFIIILLAVFSGQIGSSTASHDCQQYGCEQQCSSWTWSFWNQANHTCECGFYLDGAVLCSPTTHQVRLDLLYCMTYNSLTNTTFLGQCPYSALQKSGLHDGYASLPHNITDLNNAMCGRVHREGLLCSKCKPGHGPALLSYRKVCTKCFDRYYGWFLYLLVTCVPTTVFFCLILFFQVHTASAPLNTFVLGCQLISINIDMYPQDSTFSQSDLKILEGILLTFFSTWNLEFFRFLIPPFCVSEQISNLQALCMEYVVAFYPLLLTVLLYICIQQHARGCKLLVCLWRPLGCCLAPLTRRLNCNPAESIVHIFASFLLLSSTKIIFVSFNLLKQFTMFQVTDGDVVEHTSYLYYEPSSAVFNKQHLPYAILSFFMVFTFAFVPCVLLTLYPARFFQKFLNHCGVRWHAIHAFADAFNGCYKDGTDGTYDCRYLAGFYLFLRICYLANNAFAFHQYGMITTLIVLVSLLLIAIVSPYKSRLFNAIDIFLFTFIAFRIWLGPTLKDILDILGVVLLVLMFILYVFLRFLSRSNCRCLLRLNLFNMHKSNQHTDREPSGIDVENNIPDRLLNPEQYRPLSECPAESSNGCTTGRTLPTYGILQ